MYLRICILIFVFTYNTNAQDNTRKLPPNINRPSVNLFAPFISGDGQTIVYLTDYTDDGHHGMRWSTKKTVSTWNDEMEVNRLINRPTLNYRGGYSLSFDGNMLLFTSRKSGIGGYDIWYSNRRGNDWEAPSNFGMPVNSRTNEGAPMISPDGEYLYFMRCEKMSEYGGAAGCQIFVSEKNHTGWDEPVALPANINTGNSQTPRILADGETMIFASDQFGGKGGLDLFMTTRKGGDWSDPVPMTFINTNKDDQFISIPAKGRYLYADKQGIRDRELVQILIPEEFQPPKVMRIQGNVTDGATGNPINANLTVFNISERNRLWNEKTGSKGEFAIVLKEGAAYDFAIDTDDPQYMYFSKVYDLVDEVGARDKENLAIKLSPIIAGAEYDTEISFEEHSSTLNDNSTFELRRIASLLRKNQNMAIEVTVHQSNYKEDSLQSEPDLTELNIDSIYTRIRRPLIVHDSIASTISDTLSIVDPNQSDIELDTFKTAYDSSSAVGFIDSLNSETAAIPDPALQQDTVQVQYEIIEKLEIQKTFHNDRTEAQGTAIKEYLMGRGVEGERIEIKRSRAIRDAENEEKTDDVQVIIKVLNI